MLRAATHLLLLSLVVTLLGSACEAGSAADEATPADAWPTDLAVEVSPPDALPADARSADTLPGDASPPPDAAPPDAAPPDAGPPDAGPPDAAPLVFATLDEALDAVDPFLGTGGIGFVYAALTPAAQVPLGMVRLGPDTSSGLMRPSFNHFSGYWYDDTDTHGFSHTHFVGTGVPDFGNFRFLPLSAEAAAGEPAALFDHFEAMDKATETASPGRYGVRLPGPAVQVELTATTRGGLQRYVFDETAGGPGGAGVVFFDATSDAAGEGGARDARVRPGPDGGLDGHVLFGGSYTGRQPFNLYFSTTFEPPPDEVQLLDATGIANPGTEEVTGAPAGAILRWTPATLAAGGSTVLVRTGLSYVDAEQAVASRVAELDGRPFEDVAAAARDAWADKLRRVRLAGGTSEQRGIFFTAQYNTYRMPTRQDTVDGRYMGFDRVPHATDGFGYYSDLSLWDTFRTLHPWYSLTDHETQRDVLRSLLAMRDATGYIPRWPAGIGETNGMIGTSADVVFADAAVKDVAGVDYADAFASLRETATGPTAPGSTVSGREGVVEYGTLGYVPLDVDHDGVSLTLEYANDDNALAHLADHLGLADDAAFFRGRAGSWRNLFHAETGFMYGRDSAGEWTVVSPVAHATGMYVEGTAWHWTFFVPHDPAGLAEAFGGPAAFGEKLETLFARSRLGTSAGPVRNTLPDAYYWHGNEPCIHAAYLFDWTDRPSRGDFWLREIQTRLYGAGPDGLDGNDDGGTMSAWYLFSALGLYPIAGTPEYIVGTPLFPRAEVDLAGGGTLRVEAPGADGGRRYVRGVTWNGAPVPGPTLSHALLAGGGELRFEMAASP